MPQNEELDVLGAGRAAQQQDQSEYLPEDQIQQPQRHGGDHARPLAAADHRCSAAGAAFWNPTRPPRVRRHALGACRPCAEVTSFAESPIDSARLPSVCHSTSGKRGHGHREAGLGGG